MQSKGWIWQACLLLTSAFVFTFCLSSPAVIAQTETAPEKQSEPKSGDDEQGGDDSSDQEKSDDDDAPDKEEKQKDEDDDSDEDEDGDSDQDEDNAEDKDDDEDEDEENGQSASEDLAEAFELKFNARTTSDLDKIVRLCKSALKKGLSEGETEQAEYLASESLLRFAEGMAKPTFATPQDRRWKAYRAQAIPRLKKAVEFNDSNVAAFILLAKFEAMDPRAKEDALKNIEKAIELSADDRTQLSNALVIRARLKKDKDEKLADLNQAIKHNADNVQAHELRAWTLLSDKKVSEAIEDFNYWFEAKPENFEARIVVAQSLRATGELFDDEVQQEVLDILDEAAEINPESGIPDEIKAQIFLQQEELDKAIEAATKSIDLDKRRPMAYRIRARAHAEKGDLETALEDANRLMKLDLMDGYELRSDLFIQLAEYGKAIKDLEAMSATDPDNESLLSELARLYNLDLRPEKSIKIYNSLLRNSIVPDEGKAPDAVRRVFMAKRAALLNSRGDARLNSGQHKKAFNDYEDSLSLIDQLLTTLSDVERRHATRGSGLLNNFAWLLATSPEEDLRDGDRAIELATEAAEITNFEQAHILSTVAAGYAENGDFKTAIEWIEKGLKANEVAGEKDGAFEDAIKAQEKSLRDELKSYKKEKPWRELNDPDEERAKAKAEKEEEEGDEDDDNKSKDKKSSDDEDSDDEDSMKTRTMKTRRLDEDDEDSDDEDSDEDSDDEDSDDEDSDDQMMKTRMMKTQMMTDSEDSDDQKETDE